MAGMYFLILRSTRSVGVSHIVCEYLGIFGLTCPGVILNLPHLDYKTGKLNNLNFHPLEVVSRYRDPQPQVGENYSYLVNLRTNIVWFPITVIKP